MKFCISSNPKCTYADTQSIKIPLESRIKSLKGPQNLNLDRFLTFFKIHDVIWRIFKGWFLKKNDPVEIHYHKTLSFKRINVAILCIFHVWTWIWCGHNHYNHVNDINYRLYNHIICMQINVGDRMTRKSDSNRTWDGMVTVSFHFLILFDCIIGS